VGGDSYSGRVAEVARREGSAVNNGALQRKVTVYSKFDLLRYLSEF